jgi:hypothetical protein
LLKEKHMATQVIDYAVVIKDLEEKRRVINSRFDAAIAAIRQVMALQGADTQPELPGLANVLRSGAGPYKGLSMLDAAFEHLRLSASAVPNMQLAKALEEGGYVHKSKNFPNTLNSILWRRAKNEGDIRKSDRGWELVKAM